MVTSHQAEIRAQGAPAAADLGPLAWVLDETRKSIESATRSLKRFAHEAEAARGVDLASVDTAALRMARQQLHQVVGALEMVGQGVAAHMVRGMESAVQQFVLHPEKCSEEAAQTLERAGFALVEYLESQLGQRPRSALGLFPQFKQVQEMAGADRIHPADLWTWPWRWADPATPAAAQPLSYGPEVRSRLDQRVLKIMRHGDVNAAAELGVISRGLAQAEGHRQPAIFWKLSAGFFEALAKALVPMDIYTKRAASRILLQYASLARGDQTVSERLAQDLLFFCAQAAPPQAADAPTLTAVRQAWSLDRHHGQPYDQPTFGLYDPAVLAQARRRIESVKESWSALAGGDLARMKACVDQFDLVAESLDKLHEQGQPLGEALQRVAQQTARSGQSPGAELAMEIATAVLFLEASLEDFQPGDATFAARLQQLAERLDAVRGGAAAPPLEDWMEQLYRSVSDRQTMGTVVGELRATLGEVEQHLDQFFRNPADRSVLGEVPALMSQMRGVLSVLGLDQAALAVGRMRETVDELLATEDEPEQIQARGVFDKLGYSLGALGFQVDMLGYQPVLARKLFVYDPETGELKHVSGRVVHGDLPEETVAADTEVDFELDLEPETVAPSTMPGQLLDDSLPRETIPGQLDQLAARAALDDKPALADAAHRAAEAARQQDEAELSGALEALQAVAAPQPVPEEAPPASSAAEAIEDDDLLDIFLEEAREVVQTGGAAVEALAASPGDMDQQTTLRRAFHTLKGSSRMVGLTEFGEAAWSMEQMLNAWLAEQKPVTEELRSLAGEALQGFGAWADDIAARRDAGWSRAPFSAAADALRLEGRRIPLDLAASTDAAPVVAVPESPAEAATVTVADAEGWAAPAPADDEEAALAADAAPAAHEPLTALELPDLELDLDGDGLDIDTSLPAVTADADAIDMLEFELAPDAGEAPPSIEVPPADAAGPEALTDAAFDTDPAQVWDGPVEHVEAVDLTLPPSEEADPTIDAETPMAADDAPFDITEAVEMVEAVEPMLPLELPELDFTTDVTVDAAATVEALDAEGDAEAATEAEAPTEPADTPAAGDEVLALELDELDFATAEAPADEGVEAGEGDEVVAAEAAASPETVLPPDDDDMTKQIGDLRISTPLYNVYLNEADEWSRQLVTELSEWALELHRPVPEMAIARAHSLAGSSATVGFTALSELARAVEHALQRLHGQPQGTPEQARVLGDAAEDIRRVLHQFAVGVLKAPSADLLAAVHALEATEEQALPTDTVTATDDDAAQGTAATLDMTQPLPAVAAPAMPASTPTVTVTEVARPRIGDDIDVQDAVDPDLFPIFEEEAEELLPQMSAALRQWAGHPQDHEARSQVLRALHTLKGSARLAGALRLGEMAHRTESAIETIGTEGIDTQDLEPLLDHLDDLLAAFHRLQTGEPEEGAAEATGPLAPPPPTDSAAPSTSAEPLVRGEVAQPVPLSLVSARAAASQAVRVRAQLLDRLVDQVGEVVTSRARLETEVGQLRSSLTDLTGNLERLRQQLRDVELQAETQMQSRLAQTKDGEQNFDPLEFDRFTRMQELTRIMAESVNDVATVQRSLQRAVEASEDDLAAQARQSRELQRDLLRTRMMEFDGISERLYRVVRQASKETGKQVRLDIVGGGIEMDRGILDRMTPAFEHLLRNCVVHGVEAQAMREARGKDPVGLVTVEVQQAGNDVSVEFRDDGAGLNLPRIRERAVQQGLISAEQELSDAEIANLVFAHGFTTTTEVSELAGRGVGMDVVRTEVQALGGRIETHTREGEGSSFRLVLPLTTAVTHVVMLRAGKLSIGVPSNLVELVQRATPVDLEHAYESGNYSYGGEELPFFWSGALLQSSARSTEPPARSTPVVIFRSAEQRVALHVDEVLGNQEVVVKALGPQLSRLPGLVAITALASGAVALIYNPVALAAVYGEQAKALSDIAALPEGAVQDAELAARLPLAPQVDPIHSDIPLILVVDDSITVRRVTQRLLQREGYRVALANDGLQGLERLQQERPAVVLSDIEMPRMDGFDFVRNIRADEDMHDLPVIMITSRIAEKHREHARELGVNHYLGKPYSEDELLRLIKDYVKAAAVMPQG